MRVFAAALIGLAMTGTPALAQSSSGLWSYQFQNGIGQYSTGEWDNPTSGAIGLACKGNGNVSIMTEIAGQPTPGSSKLSLTTSSKAGSRTHSFTTGRDGSLTLRADSPAFRALWADVRARDIVTVRHAGGRTKVLSLAGARKLLPAKPCG